MSGSGSGSQRLTKGQVDVEREVQAHANPGIVKIVSGDLANAVQAIENSIAVHAEPLGVLGAIPELRLHLLPGYDRCCGGAGAFSVLQPELSGQVLADKMAALRDAGPLDAVATGNPGCIMQIGAGLRAAGLALPVLHPVELLDQSYAAAGFYQ